MVVQRYGTYAEEGESVARAQLTEGLRGAWRGVVFLYGRAVTTPPPPPRAHAKARGETQNKHRREQCTRTNTAVMSEQAEISQCGGGGADPPKKN
jgi:hypothetical protein